MRTEQPEDPHERSDDEHRFAARFEAELSRLDACGRALTSWEEESLLAALGAASLGEHELACGMLNGAQQPPPVSARHQREFRREALPIAALRRRFERLC